MRLIRRVQALQGLAVLAVALTGCGGSGDDDGSEAEGDGAAAVTDEVTIDNFEFMPDEFTVEAGQELTVTNVDTAGHTLSADDGGDFDTGAIEADGDEASLVIDEPGAYLFICEFHPTMQGTVTAVERGSSPA